MSASISFVLDDLACAQSDVIVNPTSTGLLIGHAGVNGACAPEEGARIRGCVRPPCDASWRPGGCDSGR